MRDMKNVGKFLEKFIEQEERNWLLAQLRKKGLNLTFWNTDLLINFLNDIIQREPDSLDKILNNWRQYRFKNRIKKNGTVTFQVSISRDTNSALISLQKQSKLPRNTIFEHLIKDNFQSEMTEQRLQQLRLKEIKLSEQLAKKSKVSFENLNNRLSKISNDAKVAEELTDAIAQVNEAEIERGRLLQKLNTLEITINTQKDELEELKSNLSAEKLLNSKLMKELKEARD